MLFRLIPIAVLFKLAIGQSILATNSSDNQSTAAPETLNIPAYQSLDFATLQAAAALDYSVLPAINCKTGVILTKHTGTEYDFDILGPALEVAFKRAKTDYNVVFDVTNYLYEVADYYVDFGKTQGCWMWNASGEMAKALNDHVQLIVGPACTDDMRAVNELSTYFRIPSITGAANLIDNPAQYDLLTRFGFNTQDMWNFVAQMMQQYQWMNVAMFYDSEDLQLVAEANSLSANFKAVGVKLYDVVVNGTQFDDFASIDRMLLDAHHHARIFVFVLNNALTRYFLVHAARQGMANGKYVFFAVDLYRNTILTVNQWKNRQCDKTGDGYDADALLAYKHLFVLTIKDNMQSVQYQLFDTAVRDYASRTKGIDRDTVIINYFSSTFYDSVMMFAMAIRSVVGITRSTIGPGDMSDIVNKGLLNHTYNGASGTVYINPNSDRSDDLTLYYMTDDVNGVFSVVAQFIGQRQVYEELTSIPWRTADGAPPANVPDCGFLVDGCADKSQTDGIVGGVIGAVFFGLAIAGAVLGYQAYQRRAKSHLDWVIEAEELQMDANIQGGSRATLDSSSSKSTMSFHGPEDGKARTRKPPPSSGRLSFANFEGRLVMVVKCPSRKIHFNSNILQEVKNARAMVDENILRFVGACVETEMVCVVGEYCSKAALQDLLADEATKLDWIFRYSLLSDIVKGLGYIHASVLVYHGRLTSACCYVDGKFVLKIGDYGLPTFYNQTPTPIKDMPYYRKLFWTAPELLDYPNAGSQEGDVYAFAIILSEIILREEPYAMYSMEPNETIERVRNPEGEMYRPTVQSAECPLGLLALMDSCWQTDPMERSRIPQVKTAIRQVTRGAVEKSNIVDLILSRMEQYTADLEKVVEEKTYAAQEEKRKADALLSQILPPAVAEKLKAGEVIPPETFDSATVFFSDMPGFQTMSMESSAIQIVDLLNDLYSMFDAIIPQFDVYKVETIHDSYMMASGLPTRNGLNHAREMARLALTLMHTIYKFKIRHRPQQKAQLRIGLNTGQVVTAVIGLAVPRYCLFGDTVNTASRMESTGEGLRIQISPTTKHILDGFGGFEIEDRGEIEVKGKGLMRTFWLVRELSGKAPGDGE